MIVLARACKRIRVFKGRDGKKYEIQSSSGEQRSEFPAN
jgi:hypothetical protein